MSGALDCRGKALQQAGRAIIERYNAANPGESIEVWVDSYGAGLRTWLLEAGARHVAERAADAGWRVAIELSPSPAQGSIPGVHHVLAAGESLWACERGRHVARIDARSRRVVARAAVARKASHMALDAGAERLLVADSEANELIALRAWDLAVQGRWPAPGGPQLPLVCGDFVCVTGAGSGTLTLVCLPENRAATIAVGDCPHDPLAGADGAHVYVPCAGTAELAKVRLSDASIVGRFPTGEGPSHLAQHPDGTRLYCANSWDGTVTCLGAEGERLATAQSGAWAHAIEIDPAGRWLYVANFFDDTLAVFDCATLERVALLETERYPHGLDVSPDGRFLVASGFGSGHARVFDAASHRLLARVPLGRGSSHTAFAAGCAFVACSVSDHLACLNLDTFSVEEYVSIQ
jgi:DNA-binding beta-propeller fold protein YncE